MVPSLVGKAAALRPGELESLWRELRGEDAGKAWAAAWRLADFPREAVALFGERLKPVRAAPAEVTRKLIDGLDGDTAEGREEALSRVAALGARAEPALRAALASASAEQKRRITRLLDDLARPGALTATQRGDLRAAAVLGWVATPEARQVLKRLAGGIAAAPLTRQARAMLR
jgi:hypothetical protein